MIFERILRGLEGLAKSYLEKFAETRAKLGEERVKVIDEVRAAKEEAERPKVTAAIRGLSMESFKSCPG